MGVAILVLLVGAFANLDCPSAMAQDLPSESASREIGMTADAAPSNEELAETTDASAAAQAAPPRRDRCDPLSRTILVCFEDVLRDQAGIWTSPLRAHRRDLLWLVPLGAAGAVSLHYDTATMAALGAPPNLVRVSNDYGNVGSGYALIGAGGAIYAIGKITHNERARETGVVALEALGDAGIVAESLKLATNRFRPGDGAAAGKFWPDGTSGPAGETELYSLNSSFPSGHATATWAVMHVLVDETPGHRWLHVGLYALAAGVSVARVTGRDHFPTDVIAGSAIGYLIGGYVYRQRSQYYDGHAKSVTISPLYNEAARSYGIGVSITP